jgi:DNA-binding NarL/FixJ family response regulator
MNILIIDDHPLFVDGIGHLLQQLADDVSITKTTSAEMAIEQLQLADDFDLVLLDLNMPGIDGLSLLHRFKADELCVPIIIVSAEEQAGLIRQTLDWGTMGFIPKSHSASEIVAAINRVLDGEVYIPAEIQRLLDRLSNSSASAPDNAAIKLSGISNKQFEVLSLLAKGYSNEQIATSLHRTEHTVKSHVAALFQLLGAANRTECVNIARQRQLVGGI